MSRGGGYTIYIERPAGPPIGFDEWEYAVGKVDGVRLSTDEHQSVTNPKTGEVIGLRAGPGLAEIRLRDGRWQHALRWFSGTIVLRAPRDFDDPDSAMRRLLRVLAGELGAEVIGDEGETYR
ncbi:MAG: hypothetical protein H5U24_17155 [Thioclava marina]|uniref:Uncharacterized protein n=1 Tax=Thioclava marina TaxID=1915077 RepID=A0ABX3MMU2_9RHOB|nr:hypothetical protein [Thioclava marina]MBC7147106.1 hypothetical protein [Thioclava marina]OOY12853.1 hypothetical protein BMG00_03250 [Thioclava marina]TNF15312.1 MAG: hypothetical protein EP320_04730 [Paracoccaceae bacterium]